RQKYYLLLKPWILPIGKQLPCFTTIIRKGVISFVKRCVRPLAPYYHTMFSIGKSYRKYSRSIFPLNNRGGIHLPTLSIIFGMKYTAFLLTISNPHISSFNTIYT